jgi:hypothetical protein
MYEDLNVVLLFVEGAMLPRILKIFGFSNLNFMTSWAVGVSSFWS